jgi:hypothetical protein
MKGKKAAAATHTTSTRKWPEPKGAAGKKAKKTKLAGVAAALVTVPPPKASAAVKGAVAVSSNWQALKKALPKGACVRVLLACGHDAIAMPSVRCRQLRTHMIAMPSVRCRQLRTRMIAMQCSAARLFELHSYHFLNRSAYLGSPTSPAWSLHRSSEEGTHQVGSVDYCDAIQCSALT